MNIKEAKIHIKNTIEAYFEKNDMEDYLIPVEKQRPIFLYGPPGIGKTAIMEQIAEEMGIGIVSYSMTHHTRQSAIGLPFITKKVFGGKEYDVSEYTMSEILASVYEYIEKSGKTEGILFLDEINCVSETLSPSMLRFLQYKAFGSHSVPDGWIIVTAGNPPEYNKSVRDYDIATLDRIKKIDVSADYDVWREYAVNMNIHPSIIAYLDVKKSDFYAIQTTTEGKNFVTARGWEDLSRMICVFEKKNIDIDISLIQQYLQSTTVAESFADYFETYQNLAKSFSTKDVIDGNPNNEFSQKLQSASVSEKLGFINILTSEAGNILKIPVNHNKATRKFTEILKENSVVSKSKTDAADFLKNLADTYTNCNTDKSIYSTESAEQRRENADILKRITEAKKLLLASQADTRTCISDYLKNDIDALKEEVENARKALTNISDFLCKTFGKSPELSIFISDITINKFSSVFLMLFGCKRFSEISENNFDEKRIIEEINNLL